MSPQQEWYSCVNVMQSIIVLPVKILSVEHWLLGPHNNDDTLLCALIRVSIINNGQKDCRLVCPSTSKDDM